MTGETMGALVGGAGAPGVCRHRCYGGAVWNGGLEGREEGAGTREWKAKAGGASHGGKNPRRAHLGRNHLGRGRDMRKAVQVERCTGGTGRVQG